MNVVSYPVQLNNRLDAIVRELNSIASSDADAGRQLAKILQDINMTILGDKERLVLAEKFNKAMDLFAKKCVGLSGFCAFANTCRDPNNDLHSTKRVCFS